MHLYSEYYLPSVNPLLYIKNYTLKDFSPNYVHYYFEKHTPGKILIDFNLSNRNLQSIYSTKKNNKSNIQNT